MRDILAEVASGGRLTADQIKEAVLAGALTDFNADWLARLARVCALQNFFSVDRHFARAAFEIANRRLPRNARTRRFTRLEVELHVEIGNFQKAQELVDSNPDLQQLWHGYLLADLKNPWLRGDSYDVDSWLRDFNRPFEAYNLRPVKLSAGTGRAFDRLCPTPPREPERHDGPLVTVIMTTFEPDFDALQTSIDSILQQSWFNFELIIVDDASSAEYQPGLEKAAESDPRIRLVKLTENGGTYKARNAGLREAKGEFVTGQDADDWSHPDRLSIQLDALLRDPDLPGNQAYALKVDENLVNMRVGYQPFADSAPTLCVRTSLMREVGGYLPVRKAADNEMRHRIGAFTGRAVESMEVPLKLMRILPNSLSRSDFRPGWAHPARRSFGDSYRHWHSALDPKTLVYEHSEPPSIPIPRRFQVDPAGRLDLDVVFAGDWRQLGGPQISMLNEIAALRQRGLRVGVLHLEAARFMSKFAKPLNAPVQELINSGAVTQVLPDDEGSVDLLILRYPPILQFPPHFPVRFRVGKLAIIANQVPSESDNTDIRYIPRECTERAQELFSADPIWIPQGPIARDSLQGLLDKELIAPTDVLGIIDSDEWRNDRSYYRGTRPVVGRHSRDNFVKWPSNSDDVVATLPIDGLWDVRIMGGAKTPTEILQRKYAPSEWLVFETNQTSVAAFLNSLDFFVYFHHEKWGEAFGRAILEALASGCVAILPPHFEPTFGEAAVYCQPQDVVGVVNAFYEDPSKYMEQANLAMDEVARRFSYRGYAHLIEDLRAGVIEPKGLKHEVATSEG